MENSQGLAAARTDQRGQSKEKLLRLEASGEASVYNGVMGAEKTLRGSSAATANAAIRFDDLCQLLESLGFETRVREAITCSGGGVEERINLQRAGAKRNHTRSNRSDRQS